MKFSITRLFDLSNILATKAGGELKEFIENISQLQDQLLRFGQNQITIDDNMKISRKTIIVTEGQTVYEVFGIPSGSPALVLMGQSGGAIDNPFAFNWQYDGRDGKTKVYLKAMTALKVKTNVEVILFFR